MKEALDTTALLCTLSINTRHSDSSRGCGAWSTSAFGCMACFLPEDSLKQVLDKLLA